MPTITDLYKIQLQHLEATLAESELLLQKEGGLDGELKTSGSLCEQFIRDTLKRYIVPGQFKVTSGYVATPDLLINNKNLPQCDILIADAFAPPLLKLADSKIEVLPIESVTGVIEAKRTLNKKSLAEALKHIEHVVNSTGQADNFKTDSILNGFNKSVGFHNSSSTKPLLGIIALKSGFDNFGEEVSNAITEANSLVDFVWTLDGYAVTTSFVDGFTNQLLHYTHSARPVTKTWNALTPQDFANAPSEFYKVFKGVPKWSFSRPDPTFSKEAVFAQMIGLLSLTMSRIYTKALQEEQISAYYLTKPTAK